MQFIQNLIIAYQVATKDDFATATDFAKYHTKAQDILNSDEGVMLEAEFTENFLSQEQIHTGAALNHMVQFKDIMESGIELDRWHEETSISIMPTRVRGMLEFIVTQLLTQD